MEVVLSDMVMEQVGADLLLLNGKVVTVDADDSVAEEGIPIMDAIRAYTINGAYLEGKEAEKGSIEPGKLADFVVLDRDITTRDPEEILETTVLMTIVGGRVVYEKWAHRSP